MTPGISMHGLAICVHDSRISIACVTQLHKII